jgi:hypothetical protein
MRPDPPSPGNAMGAKTTPQKAKRKDASKTSKPSPPPYATAMLSVVTQNLFNMIAVSAASGTVLLGLLAAELRIDADETLTRLIEVLDNPELEAVINRMEKGYRLRVVE